MLHCKPKVKIMATNKQTVAQGQATPNQPLLMFGKPYHVKANTQNNNAVLWQAVAAAIAGSKGKGISFAQLHSICKQQNNGSMANYVKVRQWVIPAGTSVISNGVTYHASTTNPLAPTQ